jgi:hypothetical protein
MTIHDEPGGLHSLLGFAAAGGAGGTGVIGTGVSTVAGMAAEGVALPSRLT